MQLLKQVKIIDPNSSHNGRTADILIEDGVIKQIAPEIDKDKAESYHLDGACVSVGWMDIGAWSGDPGYEFREDLFSLSETASRGGFTGLAILPNTAPPTHSKSEVLYIKHHTQHLPVDFYPLGAITQHIQGKDIAELYDMHKAGAVGFTNGRSPVQDAGTLMRALRYVKAFDGLIINRPYLDELAVDGQMHEGTVSVSLGLKGIPKVTEFMAVQRNIWLAEYTASKVHLQGISCKESVQLIRQAKTQGIPVTASVSPLHLGYDHHALENFKVNFKVLPPLRTNEDRAALIEGVKDGTIDCIISDHLPVDSDAKDEVFPHSPFGIIALETFFPEMALQLDNVLPLEEQISLITINPRKLLGLEVPRIEGSQPANLTIFHTEYPWIYDRQTIRSKSSNTPFIGKMYNRAVIGTVNQHHFYWSPPEQGGE